MNQEKQCYLLNLETGKRIYLPNKKSIILGRNPETECQDTKVSRKQIVCFSELDHNKVVVKAVGKQYSGYSGFALRKDTFYKFGHKDIIELSLGKHMFEINFEPEVTIEDPGEPSAKKPKMDFPIFGKPKPKSEINSPKGSWEDIDNKQLLIFTPDNCVGKGKIASFDIDGTIIKTKSGARFPKNYSDWIWNLSDIPKTLRKLHDDGYKLVFFTNQSGVGNDSSRIGDFKKKIVNIVKDLSLPVQVFISLGKKIYRKPRIGMWSLLEKEKNDGVKISMDESFYVGDAAGRAKDWAPKKNKDHSCADRLFALNIGLKFYTPEEYFLKQKPVPFKLPDFDPKKPPVNKTFPDLKYDKLHVILMVGGPGSGKSTYVKNHLISKGYIHVSRDKLGSWQKCVKLMEDELKNGRNVVIDNTNVDKETRGRFVQSAKKLNADVRCFVMDTTIDQMRHNNKFRELTDASHAVVSDIIIFSYRKNYQEPEMSEGFCDIVKVPCVVELRDKKLEGLYKMYLID